MSIAESVERARPAFGRDVSEGLDALDPLIGRVGLGVGPVRPEGDRVVTSALRGYRFEAGSSAGAASATVVRAAVPAAALGALDAALRESVRYALARELYGGTVLDIPHARGLLAAALADALTADALSSAAVCLADAHAPAASVAVALSAHLSCLLLAEAAQQVSVLAGSTFYARIAPFELIEQHVRDLSALSALVPDLADPLPAALDGLGAWCTDAAAPGSLLRPEVVAAIAADAPGAVEVHVALAAAAAETAAETREAFDDPHAMLELAHRVSLLTAAAAVVTGWMQARGSEAIAGDPLAMEACLRRVHGRVVRRQPRPPPHPVGRRAPQPPPSVSSYLELVVRLRTAGSGSREACRRRRAPPGEAAPSRA